MRWISLFSSLMLALGLVSVASAEAYDAEGGINWFSDYDDEALGVWDTEGADFGAEGMFTGYESDDFGFDEGIVDDTFENDDYGAYDADYEWTTDDEWFDGWYGESDELF